MRLERTALHEQGYQILWHAGTTTGLSDQTTRLSKAKLLSDRVEQFISQALESHTQTLG
ncbi:hypothetical protein PAXRUDRAFT_828168 [Paxillus rubicundulus Ve08.2h10]|uniref:Uncharacterized protein n=1 Tax=Paxillus rubicundulus Ve08.2h10 TaxID=930991 RepID=A0A0D0DWH7_9AGAM|nr:hypothetical protein PAXRUDRAFT_828168 [Paxillus rubicundulus Ve08.2h10]